MQVDSAADKTDTADKANPAESVKLNLSGTQSDGSDLRTLIELNELFKSVMRRSEGLILPPSATPSVSSLDPNKEVSAVRALFLKHVTCSLKPCYIDKRKCHIPEGYNLVGKPFTRGCSGWMVHLVTKNDKFRVMKVSDYTPDMSHYTKEIMIVLSKKFDEHFPPLCEVASHGKHFGFVTECGIGDLEWIFQVVPGCDTNVFNANGLPPVKITQQVMENLERLLLSIVVMNSDLNKGGVFFTRVDARMFVVAPDYSRVWLTSKSFLSGDNDRFHKEFAIMIYTLIFAHPNEDGTHNPEPQYNQEAIHWLDPRFFSWKVTLALLDEAPIQNPLALFHLSKERIENLRGVIRSAWTGNMTDVVRRLR